MRLVEPASRLAPRWCRTTAPGMYRQRQPAMRPRRPSSASSANMKKSSADSTKTSSCSPAQAEFRVIGEHEEVFVESADRIQHGFAVHGGAAIRPQTLCDAVVLAPIDFAGAAAAVLAVGINQVPNFINAVNAADAAGIFPDQHFGGAHADIRRRVEGAPQVGEKVRRGLRIVVQ